MSNASEIRVWIVLDWPWESALSKGGRRTKNNVPWLVKKCWDKSDWQSLWFHLRFSWNVLFIVLTRFVFCWIDHLKGADQQEWLCEIFVSKISLAAKWTLSSLNCNQCSNMSFRKPEVKDMVNNSVPFYNPSLHSLYCLSILSTRDSLCVNCEAIHVARI
jgi:hypothetical protein